MVMLAASPVEVAAREAGADVFLRKPQDVTLVVERSNIFLRNASKKGDDLKLREWEIRVG
jgi:DNA-binding response OmpR family regulator